MKTKRAFLAILILAAVGVAACSAAQNAPTATAAPGRVAVGLAQGEGGAFSAAAPAPVPAAQDAKARQDQTLPIPQAFDPDRALILTANVALKAKDPWSISDRVQQLAISLGGDVLSLSQSGTTDQRSAMLTLRVPQARFNDALRQIRDLNDVEVLASNVDGKDVTDQFVDLQARLTAKKAEEQRYLALLARADKIDDILKIDGVLGQVRTQIEQLTAQVNSIKARTTYSTITVQISPLTPVTPTADPKAYDPSKTAEHALAALTSLLRFAADAAIWTLVFGWIPLVLFGLLLVFARTRSRIAPTA